MDLYSEILGKWAEHKSLNDFWASSLKKVSVLLSHINMLSLIICNPLIHCAVSSPISFTEKWIPNVIISHRYKAQDTPARRTFEQALTGAFMSAVIKDLRPSALPFVASLIRHYTMVAVAQQCGEGLLFIHLILACPGTAFIPSCTRKSVTFQFCPFSDFIKILS